MCDSEGGAKVLVISGEQNSDPCYPHVQISHETCSQ